MSKTGVASIKAGREVSIPELLRQLASDGARWADAELALARAETGGVLRRFAVGLAAALAAFAATIVALVILAQAAVAAAAPLVNGEMWAGLIVGAGILAAMLVLGLLARRLVLAPGPPPASIILRWISGAGPRESFTK